MQRERVALFAPVALFLIGACLLYCLPLFTNLDNWGRQDWDQYTFRYATSRMAVLRDHVLPTWNPYANGGTVLLAHPLSPVLSPWFVLTLALDAPMALRVQVVLFMILGTLGMALFLRRMGSTNAGCVAGGIVFMMSSHFALQIAEGHLDACVLGLMPWLAIWLLRLDLGARQITLASIVLASVLTFGAVQTPAVYLPFFTVWMAFEALRTRRIRPLMQWSAIVVLAILLASAKLLPTLGFVSEYPRPAELGDRTPLRLLPTMFFDPRQASFYKARRDSTLRDGQLGKAIDEAHSKPFLDQLANTGMKWKFHEYGCYIGLGGLLLAACGARRILRRNWPLGVAGIVAGIIVLGASSPIDLWSLLQRFPLYHQLRVPSRFLAAVVFVMAVTASFGMDTVLDAMRRFPRRWARAIPVFLVAALYVELAAMGWSLFGDIFIVPRVELARAPEFHQGFGRNGGTSSLYPEVMDSNMYPMALSNVGTLDAYENAAVTTGDVKTPDQPGYRGEVYLLNQQGAVQMESWTMSRVRLRIAPTGPDDLILNQNFANGWKARRRDAQGHVDELRAASSNGGLVSVPVDRGQTEIELFYLPDSFILGSWISGLSLAACLIVLYRTQRKTITGTRHSEPTEAERNSGGKSAVLRSP